MIFKDLKYPEKYLPQYPEEYSPDEPENYKVLLIPYLSVLSQDCDLESDYWNRKDIESKCEVEEDKNKKITNDKFLQSILVCPAYPAKLVKKGTHLEELKLTMQKIDSGTDGI